MTTLSPNSMKAVYRERLQQARRVMEGLSETERANFNMNVFATACDSGVAACVAGFCGFDPWFQERGFVATVGPVQGSVSEEPQGFFDTTKPFFPSCYDGIVTDRPITVENAVAALNRAIELFTDSPSTPEAETA